MKKQTVVKIIGGLVFLGLAIYFWPEYQKQIPLSKTQALKVATAQISQIPAQASLMLVTEPDDGTAVVKDAIDRASQTVNLVIYELEDPAIEQALVDAENRGVKVRVILQNVNTFGRHPNQPAYDFLQAKNVPVIWAQHYFALTHQKTLMIDDKWSLIMTFNLVPKYYPTGRDFGVVDSDPQDITAMLATFNSDWNGSQIPAESGSDLVWSPGSATTLLALINSSTTSLDIYNEEMAERDITTALENAAKRGVAVRVNMTYATQWKSALNELAGAGVNVKTYSSSAKFYIHAKVIIADQQRAFVGSENFSFPSLNSNRELGILISKPDIIASLENTFNSDWLGSRPYSILPN